MNLPAVTNLSKGRIGLHLQKNSPEIFLALGITGAVGAAVWACKATLNAQYYFMEHQVTLASIDRIKEEKSEEYTNEQYQKDRTMAIVRFILNIAKLYGPSVALGTISIAMLVGSNRVLNKRNAGLMSAYALVDKAYSSYRTRVKEELGEDVDEYLRWKKPHEDGLKVVDAKKKAASFNFDNTETADLPGETHDDLMGMPSQYAMIIDDHNSQWRDDPIQLQYFLESQQRYANDRLKLRGHFFLHEAYDMLGIPRTQASAIVGWLDDGDGDNFIDFDILNPHNTTDGVNLNGYNETFVVDFNVDGVIYDKI